MILSQVVKSNLAIFSLVAACFSLLPVDHLSAQPGMDSFLSPIDLALKENRGDWVAAMKKVGGECEVNAQGRPIALTWHGNLTVFDVSVIRISKETQLKSLALTSSYEISDVAIGSLQSLSQLEDLWIHFPGLTDLGVLQFASLKQLKKLTIAELSDEAKEVLQRELPNCAIDDGSR